MVLGMQDIDSSKDSSLFAMRRKDLLKMVKDQNPDVSSGMIVIFGSFENDRTRFRQDSSFYYLTGVVEPGAVFVMDLAGHSTLYLPCYANDCRARWTGCTIGSSAQDALKLGINEILPLGQAQSGYQCCAYVTPQEYEALLKRFAQERDKNGTIFTLCPRENKSYCMQRFLIEHINVLMPGFTNMLKDISPILERMRRRKDMSEIELLYKAAEITVLAHEAAAQAIADDVRESEVQGSLEYMMIGVSARPAFPSIVASGQSSTILHYVDNNKMMKDGELVIVDIGAEYNYYCADITRTYPVSGVFNKRQRELYSMVLELQEYLATIAKPGFWINNKEHPEKSLNHVAKEFLAERGYDEYIQHGIGHYLGLDVHDVGDYSKPLQEGDVFTIEPGIYIPEENVGIRIEDDYWVVKDGLICLSESLPKQIDDIEALVQQQLGEDESSESTYSSFDFIEEETDA